MDGGRRAIGLGGQRDGHLADGVGEIEAGVRADREGLELGEHVAVGAARPREHEGAPRCGERAGQIGELLGQGPREAAVERDALRGVAREIRAARS